MYLQATGDTNNW